VIRQKVWHLRNLADSGDQSSEEEENASLLEEPHLTFGPIPSVLWISKVA